MTPVNLRRVLSAITFAITLFFAVANRSSAAIIFELGEQGVLEYRYDPNDPYQTAEILDSSGFTVSHTDVEFEGNFPQQGAFGNIDFSRNLLRFSFTTDGSFDGSEGAVGGNQFVGFRIADDPSDTMSPFTTVTVDPDSSLATLFGPERILGLGENEVFLDFQGINYALGDDIGFFFNGGPAVVPEPGSFALLGVLGTTVAYRRWSRRRKQA